MDENNKLKIEYGKQIMDNVDFFIDAGLLLVKEDKKKMWENCVKDSLSDINTAWYNAAIIDTGIRVMQVLNNDKNVASAINLLYDNKLEFLDIELNDYQIDNVANLVICYHERGREFALYRNKNISLEDVAGNIISGKQK